MTDSTSNLPVHDALEIIDTTHVYHHEEWWKAIVTYQYEDTETIETAVYLWHNDDDDEWTRKNKYSIKTPSAWSTDRQIISSYIQADTPDNTTDSFPVSDYYTVATGKTVFNDNGWWKAIVCVSEKGTYETDEVMVYVWQKENETWRRRQKYAIKSVSDWEEEKAIIDNHLKYHDSDSDNSADAEVPAIDDSVSTEVQELTDELDAHLSEELE